MLAIAEQDWTGCVKSTVADGYKALHTVDNSAASACGQLDIRFDMSVDVASI